MDPREAALREVEEAIGLVHEQAKPIELSPQNAYIRRLQHQMAEQANVVSHSRGREPYRRVRLYPDNAPRLALTRVAEGRRGIFITLEGPDGAGKSTQAGQFVERIRGMGREVVADARAGGTRSASASETLLLGRRVARSAGRRAAVQRRAPAPGARASSGPRLSAARS